MAEIRITVLAENTVYQRALRAEHGLAFWVETGDKKILFDTGQSDLLLHNANALGMDIAQTDAVVLSHGHYDHVGGLSRILDLAPQARVYLHPMALEPKFSASDEKVCGVGVIAILRAKLRANIENGRVKYTTVATSICAGVTATGQIPRVSGFENTEGQFFLDNDRTRPDGFLDDQALFLESAKGLIVLLGCAHAGVVNTLEHIQQLESDCKIHAVLGGMHLVNAGHTRIENTIDAFRRFGIDRIGPAHCTGRKATSQIWNSLRDRCSPCFVGTQVSF